MVLVLKIRVREDDREGWQEGFFLGSKNFAGAKVQGSGTGGRSQTEKQPRGWKGRLIGGEMKETCFLQLLLEWERKTFVRAVSGHWLALALLHTLCHSSISLGHR